VSLTDSVRPSRHARLLIVSVRYPEVVLTRTIALLCAAILGSLAGCSSERVRPNVVVVVIDTLRADRLPFYGHERNTAPFLDSLAKRGVVFERAWSTSSWTAPAAASLFTGLYPNQHGVSRGIRVSKLRKAFEPDLQINRIPRDIATIPEFFESLGYRTYGVADNPNISEEFGFARGFDRFAQFDAIGAARVNRVLSDWIDEIVKNEPFFVYLHYMDPHIPYRAREPWFETTTSPDDTRPLRKYDSEISYVDQHIREAFALLEVDDDTVVVVVADHGEEFLDHGSTGHGLTLYSELTRIPLLIYHPGVRPVRSRVSANVSIIDVLPTLRDILAQAPSEQDEGTTLTRYYTQRDMPEPRYLFSLREARGEAGHKRAVLFESHKLIFTLPEGRRELYDLAADPAEQTNLVELHGDVATRLRERWRAFATTARTWEQEPVDLRFDAKELEALESLGYIDDE
jgi:arylsulfatase A-like enzyme